MKGGAQTDPGECPEDEMPPEDAPCQPECPDKDEEDESSGSGSGDQPDKDADVEEGNNLVGQLTNYSFSDIKTTGILIVSIFA